MRTLFMFPCFIVVVLLGVCFSPNAYSNPYCVSGANWSGSGTMVNLGMPPESYGYIWDNLQTTNVPNMVRPVGYWQHVGVVWERYWGYLHETDEIFDATAFGDFVDANPAKIWIIGNEPNLTGQDGLSPAEYARMYWTYYEFISSRDPLARFANGAVSGDAVPGNVNGGIAYWEQVFTKWHDVHGGMTMPVDIWNFHCYASGGNRDAQYVFDVYIDPFIDWVKTTEGGVYSECEIWCTEFGVGFWHSFINAEWVAPFMQRYCLLFEQSEVDRWFWFLGPWDSWSGDWQQACLLDAAKNKTVLGEVYSDLANNYPNLTATPMPDPATSLPPDLFSDDFDDGNDDGWIRKAGNWYVEGGEYRIREYPGWWGLFSEIPYVYPDFSMEADVKINDASEDVNWAGFYFRFPLMFGDRSDGGYLVLLRQNGAVELYTEQDGQILAIGSAVADTSVFHRLKVECVGQPAEITVSVDDSQLFSWTDPVERFDTGFVALEAGHSDCSFDNVIVRNLGTSKVSENWRFY